MKTLTKKPKSAKTDIDVEVQGIEARIETVSNTLTDSELDLGASVRLSVELRELEAYIRGILFASGKAPPWQKRACLRTSSLSCRIGPLVI
jgi:hypothetical protein